jgi:hypothetical protein
MEIPFTVEQFYGVFRDYDSALAYHLACFTRINPLAHALAALSMTGSTVLLANSHRRNSPSGLQVLKCLASSRTAPRCLKSML